MGTCVGCESHEGRVWCRMLDRSSPNHLKTKSPGLNKTTGQKSTKLKRRTKQAIICWVLKQVAWYHPFGRARCGSSFDHSLGHCIQHSYRVFWTIYQKTQRLVWWEPCEDHGPHREKARYLPGPPPSSSVYYQESCCKKHTQHRSAALCEIPGWALELMKSKVTQTRMTWKTFTAVWRRPMVSPVSVHFRIWVQFLSLPIVQTLLPVTFGYSLSPEAVVMRQLRRWKRLWRRSLTRSHKRTSIGPSRSCWNGTSALQLKEISSN